MLAYLSKGLCILIAIHVTYFCTRGGRTHRWRTPSRNPVLSCLQNLMPPIDYRVIIGEQNVMDLYSIELQDDP
jgi:hypothetical protein